MKRARLSFLLGLCLIGAAVVSPAWAQTPSPSADSIADRVRAALKECDSAWNELAFVSVTHERELDGDGKVNKETVYRSRVYARHDQQHEFLEGIWENGQPVSDAKLREEQKDHEKQWKKSVKERQKEKADRDAGKQSDESQGKSFQMMDPFRERHRNDYDFTPITPDTLAGRSVWKIGIQPRRESEDLFRGNVWVTADAYRPLAEEYELAKLPSGVKGMRMRFDHVSLPSGCSFPQHVLMRAHGRALLVIKFNMEVETQMDSVQVNPGLPDSLFTVGAD